MKYISTRAGAPNLDFEEVLLTGLARDGGLYVPENWPQFSEGDIKNLRGLSYSEVAVKVIHPFVRDVIPEFELKLLVNDTYQKFNHSAIAPIKQLGPNQWLTELFHGPTLAFKDYPLQLVGRLFDYVLKKRKNRITIIGATSGDTGSAAIEACKDKNSIDVFIMHPKNRVSEVQRRQMTTVKSSNIHNIALDGTFDDCQDMVKDLFADQIFRDKHNLSAINSINWARIMGQIVYYFWTAISLGAPDRKFIYAVPTGNFGNVYAGYAAKQMGLPIDKFIIGSNENNILTRFFAPDNIKGRMSMSPVLKTLSPSMDIQVSSNFERLLFDSFDRNGRAVANALEGLRKKQTIEFGEQSWSKMSKTFQGISLSNEETKASIIDIYKSTGELLDPHSVIGLMAGKKVKNMDDSIMVSLATAHPAKFPDTVKDATDIYPNLPAHLSDLFDRDESFTELPNNIDTIRDFINKKLEEKPINDY